MFSLHVGQTLVRLIRAYANAQRPGRYCSWLGLALAAALTVSAGVTLAWRDISSNSVSSVPAASYEAVPIAPESIVTAFGSNLATRPAEASDADPNTPGVQLPTTLDGTTVEVNGRRAGLLFVSPTQVNYVMPEATEIGLVNVVVKSGDGATSNGIAQITQVSPAIFTANSTGKGVPAALIYRVKADGQTSYESLSQRSGPSGPFITKPIEMPVGDSVYLVLYLTGLRRAAAGSVRVLMDGEELTPVFSAAPDFIGLDQLNVEIPRSLAGRGVTIKVSVTAGGATSNPVDIEMAGVGGASPPQVGVFGDPVLAGSEMLITGSGFSPIAAENIVRIGAGLHQAEVMRATPTLLTVLVPFGVEAGTVRVTTPTGEGVSASELSVRTSISGLVEDTLGRPLKDVRVSAILRDRTITETTNAEGHFVLPVDEGLHPVEVDGGAINVNPPYPRVALKIIAQRNRDNVLRPTALQQETGSGGTIGSGSSLSDDDGHGLSVAQKSLGSELVSIETDGFRLEIQDSTQAKFPDNTTSGKIFLTPLQNARTPVELPLGYISSSIAQITPFGVELDPGAKLIFPNKDGLPAGAPAILYRYDHRDGKFVQDSAKAFVSADGKWIETEPGAIKITTYYFAAKFRDRDLTTIYGHVFEKNGKTPVARALARFRGHEARTDNTGSYVLRYVAVKEGEQISVEVSAVRPNGRVDRAESAKVASALGSTTKAPDVIMPGVTENRPPTIIGPKSLAIEAGKTREERIIVTDPDPNQTLQVKVEDAPFATVIRGGFTTAVAYTLRLSPTFAQAGRYKLRLTATDGAGGIGTYAIDVTVKSGNRAPTVNNKTVVMDEDTPGAIKLEGADLDANRLSFAVVTQPSKGRLSGSAPNLIYTPNLNFAGSDRFTFKANDGDKDSNIATVTITVRPVNDPPSLAVPAAPRAQPVSEGQTINLAISASDPDVGQKLTFTAMNLPGGARLTQATPTSAQFRWTPGFTQAGTYTVSFNVTDAATPSLSDTKELQITVLDAQHNFAEDPADLTVIGTADALSPSRGSGAGFSVAIGDLDGDRVDDLVVGSPTDNGAGQVHVFLGSANPKGAVDLAKNPADVTIRGEAVDDLFGSSLAISDINADGKADLIIGAPTADATPNAPDSGKVYAIFGALAPGAYDIAKIANLMVLGGARGDHLGASLAVGKISGDSGPESLMIGAPLFDVPGPTMPLPNAGCVYGFFSAATLTGIKDLGSSSADFTITGVVADGQLGASLATGNFNADTLADIAIGAPTADFGGLKGAGVVYLVPGSQSLKGAINATQASALLFNGPDSGDGAGSSLAMGDLNGDGRAELIIGAPEADGPNNTRPGSGEVYVLFGMQAFQERPSQLTIFAGDVNTDEFPDGLGASVASGDFTGDGIPDLIMGAPGADPASLTRQPVGAAYMLFGRRGFAAGTFDLTSKAPDLKIFGAKPGDRLGNGGFAFGRLDLLGANDLAIGIPAASRGDSTSSSAGGAGEVRVLRGVIR